VDIVLHEDFVEDLDAIFKLLNHAGCGFNAFESSPFDVRQCIDETIVAPRRRVASYLDVSHENLYSSIKLKKHANRKRLHASKFQPLL
jgi:hypothetical protein